MLFVSSTYAHRLPFAAKLVSGFISMSLKRHTDVRLTKKVGVGIFSGACCWHATKTPESRKSQYMAETLEIQKEDAFDAVRQEERLLLREKLYT